MRIANGGSAISRCCFCSCVVNAAIDLPLVTGPTEVGEALVNQVLPA